MRTTTIDLKTLRCLIIFFLIVISACKKEISVDENAQSVNQIKSIADSIIQNTKVPGLVAIIIDKKKNINLSYAVGLSDIPNKIPITKENTFRIGSNTKTFTGTILLQLVEEGKVLLEDPLSTYFPNYPKSNNITIRMLCNMTTGIPDYTLIQGWMDAMEQNPAKKWDPTELVNWAFTENFLFEPGTQFNYSNTNTVLLGMIIEKVTGNTLEKEINNRIVQPLQLSRTGLITSGISFPGPFSKGYYLGSYVARDEQTEVFDYSYIWAAGSVYSTPKELQHYAEALVEGSLLSPKMQLKRLTEVNVIAPNAAYGYSLLKRGSFYGHNGTVFGYTSSMYHSKERASTIIIYFNGMLEIHPDYLFNRIVNLLYGKDY